MTDSGCEFKNSSDISPNRLEPLCLSEKWKVRCFVNTSPTSHPHLTLFNDDNDYDDDYDYDYDDLSALWAV